MKKAVIDRLKKEAQTVVGEGLGGNYYATDEDKLIELIVKECILMVERAVQVELDPAMCIKEHFGVEE